jgi:DNA-binding transcriptional ArsR family regulator
MIAHNHTRGSIAAAKLIAPHAGTQCERIMAYLRDCGLAGATREELAEGLGMRLASVCGRIAELRAQGLIYDRHCDRPGSSGVKVEVLCAVVKEPRQMVMDEALS